MYVYACLCLLGRGGSVSAPMFESVSVSMSVSLSVYVYVAGTLKKIIGALNTQPPRKRANPLVHKRARYLSKRAKYVYKGGL